MLHSLNAMLAPALMERIVLVVNHVLGAEPAATQRLQAHGQRIIELQIEHRDLDEAIERLAVQPGVDELALRRMKKRKLQIKDSVRLLEMRLVPDIPA
mgnify:CR=1 FL=1